MDYDESKQEFFLQIPVLPPGASRRRVRSGERKKDGTEF
jgi:hypothetical protein